MRDSPACSGPLHLTVPLAPPPASITRNVRPLVELSRLFPPSHSTPHLRLRGWPLCPAAPRRFPRRLSKRDSHACGGLRHPAGPLTPPPGFGCRRHPRRHPWWGSYVCSGPLHLTAPPSSLPPGRDTSVEHTQIGQCSGYRLLTSFSPAGPCRRRPSATGPPSLPPGTLLQN